MTSTAPPLAIVIIGAGKGTRMRSSLAKVLHPLAGRPLIVHVLDLASSLSPCHLIAIVGHQADRVRAVCEPLGATCVLQEPQLGTGHAVAQAEPLLRDFDGDILVLYGDVPLLQSNTIYGLWDMHQQQQAAVTVLTAFLDAPTGYGRIIRDTQGHVVRIVEERDATDEEKAVREVNSGIYCLRASFLFSALDKVGRDNAQGEQYLTDVVAVAVQEGFTVAHLTVPDAQEIVGINTRVDLAKLEAIIRRRICETLMLNGVSIIDPATTVIDPQVHIEPDTVIAPFTHILGSTTIASGCHVGPQVVIQNCRIGEQVHIQPFCVLKDCEVPAHQTLSSFSHRQSS